MNTQRFFLPRHLESALRTKSDRWTREGNTSRLWSKDATLWTGGSEAEWLGWLEIPQQQLSRLDELRALANQVRSQGFEHALLLGMGGSSLCPEVLALSFGPQPGFPQLLVLDSVDPRQVRACAQRVRPDRTLFIVSSKSGSTLEPNCLMSYFYDCTVAELGPERAGRHFMAITDPGSALEAEARARGFQWICHGVKSIGGRFSALSNFGMVPAAVMGLDVGRFIETAQEMVQACRREAADQNPGVLLGLLLGTAWEIGHDKLTVVCSPQIHDFGAWLEQLIAESTGKHGRAIIPVDREPVQPPEMYGPDRLFVYLRCGTGVDPAQDAALNALRDAGMPVVWIDVPDLYSLSQEFFRWEIATAVAGAVMHINPFDQPDVEASKVATRRLTAEFERTGGLGVQPPVAECEGLRLYVSPALESGTAAGSPDAFRDYLRRAMTSLRPGEFFALLAFVEMSQETERHLQCIRQHVLRSKKVATCLGFGPRFLHSTGQAYKGGPNTGVFLQITYTPDSDMPVPGKKFTFGVIERAQAQGDFEVMAQRGRRILMVDLGTELIPGLKRLEQILLDVLMAAA